MNLPAVCFAIPAMDELGTLEKTLECIARQDYRGKISVWVCVNGPYSDYEIADNDNIRQAIENAKMRILHNELLWNQLIQNPWNLDLHLIDRYSPEKAWREKQAGVGLARQHCIAALLPHASDDNILISMDADTLFHPDFVREVVHCLQRHPHATAVNPPYYHPLSGDEAQDRAMLRYEIYLRCHLIQLLRIGSPYAFTALGSAIACRLSDYQKSGGYDSQQAGEDFYLLQKLAKMGKIALDCRAKVYPANRLSDRVPFGTGPAIKIFQEGIQGKYPIFSKKGYDAIAQSYQMLPALQQADVRTPLTDFLDETFPQKGGWDKLRKNYPGLANFTKAFHQKADGLRLFQFLKAFRLANPSTDEENLQELWDMITEASHDNPPAPLPSPLRLDHLNAATLHLIRLELETFEERLRMRRE
ncbi:MAG: glycosyltransferase family 2 protein [Bacteroidales bacterium]|nr:glycosyltransferase family 2 protein [Bacteroidales bacterium]